MGFEADWRELQHRFLRYRDTGAADDAHFFFENVSQVLSGFFRRRLSRPEDVADLVQMSLVKIHAARFSFDESQSLKPWVFTVASRVLIDVFRKRGRDPLMFVAGPEVASEAEPSGSDLSEKLEVARAGLRPADQEILSLYAEDDLSVRDIAARVGSSEGAVKVRLHRIYKFIWNSLS